MSRGFVTQMLSQQNTRPLEWSRAHYLQRMPQADLVGRQDRLTQVALQPIDDVERTPIAACQHDRVSFRPVDAAPDIEGGLRIEQSDLEIANEPQRLLGEDLDAVGFKKCRDALVDRSAPRRAEDDLFDGKRTQRLEQRRRGRGGRLAACRAYAFDQFLIVAGAIA